MLAKYGSNLSEAAIIISRIAISRFILAQVIIPSSSHRDTIVLVRESTRSFTIVSINLALDLGFSSELAILLAVIDPSVAMFLGCG
jgi:hypothetical protein